MTENDRTPGAGTPRALGNVFAGTTDAPRDIAPHQALQAARIACRFRLSSAVVATVAEMAFGIPEKWRRE